MQYHETNQRAVDDAQGKQRHHDADMKTTVEKVHTTLNQKFRKWRKVWRRTTGK